MKKILNYHVATILIFVFSAMALCSCGDDDDDVILQSYILGNWHSYKAVTHYLDEAKTMNISKNGDYSQFYWEFDFNKNGSVIVHFWSQDDNGRSRWAQGYGSYEIRGDEVWAINSSGSSSSIINLFFDSKDKELYMRFSQTTNGTQVTTYLFFRK